MKVNDLKRRALKPFDSLQLAKRYFAAVKSMDAAAPATRKSGIAAVMRLWSPQGTLRITGPDPIGEQSFSDPAAIRRFYAERGKGVHDVLDVNVSTVGVANAKSPERLTISGTRYVVNTKGEGMEVPFTHNFDIEGSRIRSLHINIGQARASEVAPIGSLGVEDMGRLAAMAWMVA